MDQCSTKGRVGQEDPHGPVDATARKAGGNASGCQLATCVAQLPHHSLNFQRRFSQDPQTNRVFPH